MPPTSHPYLRRATTSVLVAVALISGAILLLGDRFEVTPSYALTQPARAGARMAACVAEENMRLINTDQQQCDPGELQLASQNLRPPAETSSPGPAGRPGADEVSEVEIVTVRVAVPNRQAASGEARCPAGKVALGGGVLPDGETPRKGDGPDHRMAVVVSGPLLPGPETGSGWTATVRNTGAGAPLSVVVAAICVTTR